MSGAKVEVYKAAGETKLKLFIFNPAGAPARSAIVFFFGGGWKGGSPVQFETQCRYFASRGMLAVAADYRVSSRNGTKITDCVRDAKSALRYLRQNASRLGIDPQRIAAAGGSAGGHLAAAAGIIPGLDDPAEDASISSRANALVLFNPAVVTAAMPASERMTLGAVSNLPELEGIDRTAVSPWHHIAPGNPPTIIFHGRADTTVPYATVEAFTRKMLAAGNRCELVGFDGAVHGFFNYRAAGNKEYDETLQRADKFLTSLGYLRSPGTK